MIQSSKWRPVDGITLEPNALAAVVEVERNLALTAGPGAGKTEMLAQKADFLLRTGICYYPQRILAISFKVDAASNLRKRVRLRCGADLGSRLDSYTFHAFAKRIIDRFRPVLQGRDALDPDYTIGVQRFTHRQIEFGDLIPLAGDILRQSTVALEAVRMTYSHIFLDEFQDCTDQQYSLIKLAFEGTEIRLTAVGDTKQKIMGFAGALEGIFLKFAADFAAKPLNLYQNFRSLPHLRRMQNDMIAIMEPGAAVPQSDIVGDGGIIDIFQFSDDVQEADVIANMIKLWLGEGVKPSDIAVLFAKQIDLYAPSLKNALHTHGIAFRDESQLQDLVTQPVANLIIDGLCLAVHAFAPDAYARVMSQTIADDEADRTGFAIRSQINDLLDEVRSETESDISLLGDFSFFERFIDRFIAVFPDHVLTGLSDEYQQGIRLQQVIDDTKKRLREAFQTGLDVLGALSRFSGEDSIKLMTVHKSKGLEFQKVIFMAIEIETFWGKPDEERATFFVGISRAKEHLVLAVAASREWPHGAKRWSVARRPHSEFISYAAPYSG